MVVRPVPLPQNVLTVSQFLERTRNPPSPVRSHLESIFNIFKSVFTAKASVALLPLYGPDELSITVLKSNRAFLGCKQTDQRATLL